MTNARDQRSHLSGSMTDAKNITPSDRERSAKVALICATTKTINFSPRVKYHTQKKTSWRHLLWPTQHASYLSHTRE